MGRKTAKERKGRGSKPKAANPEGPRLAVARRGIATGEPPSAPPAIVDGMRVRLKTTERWLAGTVRRGSCGTIYFSRMKDALGGDDGALVVPCIRWDRVKAREGYHFALGMRIDMLLPGWLEMIPQEGGRP